MTEKRPTENGEPFDFTIEGVAKEIGQRQTNTIANVLVRYIASQPFTNVLLCIGIGGFYWAVWYALTTAIPDDRKMIQSIIKEVQDTDKEERQKDRTQYDSWIRYMADQRNEPSHYKPNSVNAEPTGAISSRE